MKFSTKLAALFSITLLAIFAIITYLGYTSSTRLLEAQIREKLEDHASHTIAEIDRMFFERYIDMSLLANDPVIRSRSSTHRQIKERLSEYQNQCKFFSSLSFFDLNRIRIADTLGKDIGKRHPFTEYWPDIAAGSDLVMVIAESQTTKKVTVYFASVVKDNKGSTFGVVVSRMPVESLYEIISEQTFHTENKQIPKVELLDKEGLILYSSYNIQGILKKKSDDWEYIKGLISTGKNVGSAKHSYLGEEEITAFARERGYRDFKGNQWILVICTPTDVAFASVAKQNRMRMITFPIIGIFSLLSIFLFSRTVTRPLKKLSFAAAKIGRGNLDIKVDVSSQDEIGQLAQAFNEMSINLKRRTAELKEERDKAQKYLDVAGVMFAVLDNTGKVTSINLKGCEILGYEEDDIIGKDWFSNFLPERMKEEVKKVFLKIMAGDIKPVEHFENPVLTRSGDERIIAWHNTLLTDKTGNIIGTLSSGEDITERKKAEEALRQSEKKLRDVTSSLGEGIYVLDERGYITFMNPEAEQLLGWTEAELINKNAHDIIHSQKADGTPLPFEDCPIHKVIKNGDRFFSEEQVFKRKDGTLFPVLVLSSPIIENGKIIASVTAFQDITERRLAEEQIKKQSAELIKLNNELSVLYEEMKVLSLHDPLTELANRRLMDILLEKYLARAKRYERPLTIIMLDIDYFKKYNDTYGHPAGDKLLCDIAQVISRCVRDTDLVVRYGGEEFVILLPETTLLEAQGAGERIRKAVEAETGITVSLGVSAYSKSIQNKEDMINKADAALYQAKQKGRNRVELI